MAERGAILGEVLAEISRAQSVWGIQDHDPHAYLAILGEEFGEACKAAVEIRWGSARVEFLRAELVQVAAVAVAMVECLDRGAWRWGRDGLAHDGIPDDSRPPEERHARELERCLREVARQVARGGHGGGAWEDASRVLNQISEARHAGEELPF